MGPIGLCSICANVRTAVIIDLFFGHLEVAEQAVEITDILSPCEIRMQTYLQTVANLHIQDSQSSIGIQN